MTKPSVDCFTINGEVGSVGVIPSHLPDDVASYVASYVASNVASNVASDVARKSYLV